MKQPMLFVLAAALFAGGPLRADELAETTDGRTVILKNDGTWRYARQSDLMARKLMKNKKTPQKKTARRSALLDFLKSDPNADFRNVAWGMTPQQVKKREDGTLVTEGAGTLEYSVELFGFASRIRYLFTEGKLAKIDCKVKQDHMDPKIFLQDFEDIKKYMQRIHGTPVSDQYIWHNDMYRNDRKNWGFALSLGFLTCRVIWQDERSKIVMNISGKKHRINTNIEYLCIVK